MNPPRHKTSQQEYFKIKMQKNYSMHKTYTNVVDDINIEPNQIIVEWKKCLS